MNSSDFSSLNDHDLLITLIGEVKAMREDFKRMSDNNDKNNADFEARIRALEQNRWTIAGAATVLAAGASFLVSYLTK